MRSFTAIREGLKLYRALGQVLRDKRPNPAHEALVDLERLGRLHGIVTQNVDNLHQLAGSTRVFEIHGEHLHLQCLRCSDLIPLEARHLGETEIPRCPACAFPLKPNVVLFGEDARQLDEIHEFIEACDLLLVIGTRPKSIPPPPCHQWCAKLAASSSSSTTSRPCRVENTAVEWISFSREMRVFPCRAWQTPSGRSAESAYSAALTRPRLPARPSSRHHEIPKAPSVRSVDHHVLHLGADVLRCIPGGAALLVSDVADHHH